VSRQVDDFEVAKRFGAPNHRAESAVAQQAVADPLPLNLANRCDRIVFIRFPQVNVVAPFQVFQWEHFASLELEQERQSPGIFTCRFGSDISKTFLIAIKGF
jgi:hypothetical protein